MSAAKILVLIQAKIPVNVHTEIQAAKIQTEGILRARDRVSRLFYRKPDFTMIPCNMKALHKYYPLVLHMMASFHQPKYADHVHQQLDKFVSEKQINITLSEV